MKKVVLKFSFHGDKDKQKAKRKVSCISGVESISIDMKGEIMTVTGDVDPVVIVTSLRKFCYATIMSIAVGKEEKKDLTHEGPEYVMAYNAYNPILRTIKNPSTTTYYYVRIAEQDEVPKPVLSANW